MLLIMNDTPDSRPVASPAVLGWRLLALLYDAVIAIAIVFLISVLSLALKPDHRPVQPGSFAAYAVFFSLWAAIGAYAVVSWRRGGQTIGMKPWRLIVTDGRGLPATWSALSLRYAVVSASFGLSLLWALVDGQRRGLHDIAAGTLLLRTAAKSA
jgi:uncharacterized RDD family membrane protein YckC